MAEETSRNIIELVWKSIDQSSDVLKAMGKATGDFGKNLEGITGPAASVTSSLVKFEAGILAVGVALGAFAVNEAGKFDASMRELSTLINGGEEGAKKFGVAITEMGQHSLVSLEDLTGAMYKAVSQVGSLEKAQQLVTVSEKLAVAGRADLTDTTLLLAGSLEAYGKNMDSAAHFSDVLFGVVQNGQTTLTELTQDMGKLAPTASSLGISFDSLGAAVALTTKNAIPTAEAVSGLRAALSNILKPSTEATKLAEQLGIKFSAAGLKSKGFAGFMVDVAEKTHGSSTQMGVLFGSVEAFNVVMALASEGGSKFTAMLHNIEQSTGATQQAYDLMSKSFGAGNQVIVNNLKLVAIAFGSQLLEPVRHVQEAITNFFIKIQDAAKAGVFDEFFTSAKLSIESFATALETVLTNLPAAFAKVDFGPLKEQIALLGDAFGGIGDNIDLTSVDGLAKALQLVTDGITQFVALNRGMIETLPKVFTVLKDIGGILLSLDPQWVAIGGTLLASLSILDKASGAWGALSLALGGAGTALGILDAAIVAFEVNLAALTGGTVLGLAALSLAVTGVGIASYTFGTLGINPFIDWLTKATTGSDTLGAAIYDWTHNKVPDAIIATREHAKAVQDWSFDIDASIQSLGGFNGVLKDYTVNLGLAAGMQGEAGASAGALSAEAQALADAFGRAGQNAGNAAELATQGFTVTTASVINAKGELVQIPDVYTNIGTAAQAAADATETALEKSFKATQAAKDKAEEFRLEWAKLESQERQLIFEVAGKIAVAQIEADASKVVAAFESIGESVKSTGETINGLVKSFAGISSGKTFDKSFIESLIKDEMNNRKRALELQEKLTNSQLRYLDAATEKLKQGDALITIKSDSLRPELSAFMFKILETIQVEANGQGQAYLLGLPPV